MKMFLCIFCLFCALSSFAYTKDDIHLTDYEFTTSVKPQLNNILQDYYSLLGLLTPPLKPYKKVFQLFASIKSREEKFINYCEKSGNNNCIQLTNQLLETLNEISVTLAEIPSVKETDELPMNQLIISYSEFQKLQDAVLDLYFQFFQFHFFYQSDITSIYTPLELSRLFTRSYDQFNIFLIKSCDNRFEGRFLSYWNGFIKPISFYVLSRNEKEHFISNINDFNLRWNMLNVELTKRNMEIPKQAHSLLQIMHNRWNSILKVTLR